uniref:Mitochondrial Rho GTPase n=1 Tax=Tetradesmus obliquus TaxID=3088 RepID=A0A383VCR8_TETOB
MNGRRRINVAVVGDRGVGKTSLITSAAQEVFSERPVPVLPPTRFPADFAVVSEPVDVIAFDTSSRPEDAQAVDETIRAADVVIVCFDAQRKSTLQRLRSDWLPRITHLRPAAPVIIACCKDDTEDTLPTDQIREFMEGLIREFPVIEVSIRTSSRKLRSVLDVFYQAIKTVLYPKAPLLDATTGRLTTPCVKALLRIFLMCDSDGDGALNDEELNTFQFLCFGQPLTPDELASVRQMVAERMADGLSDAGLLFPGFMYLHTLFLTRGRLESTWTVLRLFGYNEQLRISDSVLDRLPRPPGSSSSSSSEPSSSSDGSSSSSSSSVLELSEQALLYLGHVFDIYDSSRSGVLSPMDLEHMFNRAPVPIYQVEAWNRVIVAGAGSSSSSGSSSGGLTKEGFLTRWKVITLQDPRTAFEQMLYLGMGGRCGEDAGRLFVVKPRRRKPERRKGALGLGDRGTLVAGLFGGLGVGKSSLVKALAGRHYNEPLHGLLTAAGSTSSLVEGAPRTLVIHEASSAATADDPTVDLSQLDASSAATADDPTVDLSQLDVAAVLFDSAEPASFRQAVALVTGLSGRAGDSLPFVLIAAKDDLGMSNELEAEVHAACKDLALPLPIPVSVLLGSLGHHPVPDAAAAAAAAAAGGGPAAAAAGGGRSAAAAAAAAARAGGSNVFVALLLAAMHPEGNVPDTPARKARRQTIRRLLLAGGVAVTSAASLYAGYRLYRSLQETTRPSSSSSSSSKLLSGK